MPSQPPHFLSWNASRAFIRGAKASNSSQHLRTPLQVQNETCEDNFSDIVNVLKLPASAPSLVTKRETNHLSALIASRALFSKKARRSLNSVVNPGGGTLHPLATLSFLLSDCHMSFRPFHSRKQSLLFAQ
jgi:hypothetical protein